MRACATPHLLTQDEAEARGVSLSSRPSAHRLVPDGPNRASSAGAEGLAAGMPEIAVGRDRPTILAGQAIPVLVFDLCKDSGQTADA